MQELSQLRERKLFPIGIHQIVRLLLFLIIVSGPALILAQSPDYLTYPTLISDEFDFGDGEIVDIQEDWNGFIWVATSDGLYRFDGTEAIRFDHSGSLPKLLHPRIYALYLDRERKRLWVGTLGGLTLLDPLTGRSEHFRADYSDTTSIADNLVRSISRDQQGNIWIGCMTRGLSKYLPETNNFQSFYFEYHDLEKARKYNPAYSPTFFNNIFVITPDSSREDRLWLSTSMGLASFDTDDYNFSWVIDEIGKDHFPNIEYINKRTSHILPLQSSLIFSRRNNILEYDFHTHQVQLISKSESSEELGNLIQILVDKDGDIYAPFEKGLVQIGGDPKEVQYRWIDNEERSQFHGIQLQDSKNRVWVDHNNKIALYQNLTHFPRGYLLPQEYHGKREVSAMSQDGELILLTDDHRHYHIFNFKEMKWETRIFKGSQIFKLRSRWRDISHYKDNLYFLLSSHDLWILNLETGEIYKKDLDIYAPQHEFLTILKDRQENIWISSMYGGLFKIDWYGGRTEHYENELASPFHASLHTWITDMYEDSRGYIWIRLARSFAIYKPEIDDFLFFHLSQFPENTFRYISNFAEDGQGNIWLGSLEEGLGLIQVDKIAAGVTTRYDINKGLLHNGVQEVRLDASDDLWILSEEGLSLLAYGTQNFINFKWQHGIPKAEAFHIIDESHVALVLDRGICVVEKGLFHNPPPNLQPFLTEIKVNNQVVTDGVQLELEKLEVHGRRDNLSFKFSALGFFNPKYFAYRLIGIDKDWVVTEDRQTPLYSNLRPGEYNFELKVKTRQGEWGETQTFSVFLVPRWWETIWFKFLCGSVILGLLYFLYSYRLKAIRKAEIEKSEYLQKISKFEMQALRSQMNPHFLYNSLNSIQHFIIQNKTKEAVHYLDKFSRLVRLILQNSRSQKIPLSDEINALELYLDLEASRFKEKFEYEINVDDGIPTHDIDIPPMLIQPYVENAILHGILNKQDKGHLQISIKLEGDMLICSVKDDGIGRTAAQAVKRNKNGRQKSMGMHITQNRIDIINLQADGKASVEIHDLYDEQDQPAGTDVVVKIAV